jgi:transposase
MELGDRDQRRRPAQSRRDCRTSAADDPGSPGETEDAAMIALPKTIFVATTPVNLHLSFDRLASIVRDQLGGDPKADTLVVFHNRRRTHVKLLWHDGVGYCVFYKRLDRGTYRIPTAIPPTATRVAVRREELVVLLAGLDRARLRRARASARAA